MKIAVLADIHANYPALLEVAEHVQRWGPDAVFVAGDTVNRGPRSLECLRFVQERVENEGWRVIRGNHEGYVIWHARPDAPRSGTLFDVFRYSYWTYEQLGADVSVLKAMPKQVSQNHSEAGEFRVVHASMKGERRGIYPGTDEDALLELIAPPPAVLAVGHTHRPLIRRVEDALVVNAGSVGLPFDGDQRAAYAQIVYKGGSWSAEIIRLSYDVAQAERDFYATGFLRDAGPLSRLILLELQLSLSQFHCWVNRYMDSVLEGEISVDEAVEEYLGNPITQLCW